AILLVGLTPGLFLSIPMYLQYLIPILATLLYIGGLACAAHAVCTVRTPQGSIAWAVSLITFPLIAVPLYLVFGRSKFEGYVEAMRVARAEGHGQVEELIKKCHTFAAELPPDRRHDVAVLQRLAVLPCLGRNSVRLLIDGQATFDAIFEGIRQAKS